MVPSVSCNPDMQILTVADSSLDRGGVTRCVIRDDFSVHSIQLARETKSEEGNVLPLPLLVGSWKLSPPAESVDTTAACSMPVLSFCFIMHFISLKLTYITGQVGSSQVLAGKRSRALNRA